jgi:hypothetical protein
MPRHTITATTRARRAGVRPLRFRNPAPKPHRPTVLLASASSIAALAHALNRRHGHPCGHACRSCAPAGQ